jgi:hypothetical protein
VYACVCHTRITIAHTLSLCWHHGQCSSFFFSFFSLSVDIIDSAPAFFFFFLSCQLASLTVLEPAWKSSKASVQFPDAGTCVSYEEEDTCVIAMRHLVCSFLTLVHILFLHFQTLVHIFFFNFFRRELESKCEVSWRRFISYLSVYVCLYVYPYIHPDT